MPSPIDSEGRKLVGLVPGGRISEPLREDVGAQMARLVACCAHVPLGDVTWYVEVRGG